MIGPQRIHHNHQHVGCARRGRRKMRHRIPLLQPLAALHSGKNEYPQRKYPRCGPLPELQEGLFPLAAPAGEGHGDAQSQQKTGAVVEPAGQGKPVIDAEECQQKDQHSNCGKAGRETSHGAADQRQRQEENDIHDRGNPKNLPGHVDHRAPSRPIEPLEEQQPRSFHQARKYSRTQTHDQQRAGIARPSDGRFVHTSFPV